jgi:hypothetical protein
MQISSDGNYQYINYVREISASITTGAILKLDYNMDTMYSYFLNENLAGTFSHDFTSIALGNDKMIYMAGNVEVSGRVNSLIIKLQDSSNSVLE